MRKPPFDTGPASLFVAYYASAEVGCFLGLGWHVPAHILDLFTEFRRATNGLFPVGGNGLVGALQHYGIPSIDVAAKDSMRALAMRGGPYTREERTMLLDYCESDVIALERLLSAMWEHIDLPRALLRGQYMAAAAQIEHNGIPIDATLLAALRNRWDAMQDALIARVDKDFGVYDGRTFKQDRFAAYLTQRGIAWPVLSTGRLNLEDSAFKDMAKLYPALLPLKELRATLSGMRLSDLAVGRDGRNRCLLSAFSSRTGRNQPSNARFIFGPAVWMRGLIKPPERHGVAYIDWSQQEFGIAAALSDDPLMMKAYHSSDPYLEFAKQAGAAPMNATKQTHKLVREQFKACVLAVQYGMGAESLAQRIGKPVAEARHLLNLHRNTYCRFWEWSDATLDYAMLNGRIHTAFGWQVHVGADSNPRSLRNFPMQANGAEMMRLACIRGLEAGIKICAPVHDALLIEAPVDVLDEHIARMQSAMAQASRDVLGNFELRSGVERFVYPDRYMDERGAGMWIQVQNILQQTSAKTIDLPISNR